MGGPRAAELRETLLVHLHVARHLATNPHALALLLESVGPDAPPVRGSHAPGAVNIEPTSG